MPNGVLVFSIGTTEFGRTLGLNEKIRAIISQYLTEIIEVKSTRGENVYPGFVFHELPVELAGQILDSVISAVRAGAGELIHSRSTSFLLIAWAAGDEKIEFDILNYTEKSAIRQTIQHVNETGEDWIYETTSKIRSLEDGRLEIKIHYDPLLNPHISVEDSWWGTTTIVLNEEQSSGTAHWTDDNLPIENVEDVPFQVFQSAAVERDGSDAEFDELEIESRLDLESTDRQLLIKARRGQGLFRARVLKTEKICRVTGTAEPMHLRASHIKPWAVALDSERLDGYNGLMLAPHIDHLFDRAYISFDDDGRLLVLNDEVMSLLDRWGIDADNPELAPRPFLARQCEYLKIHRRRFDALKKRHS